MALVGLGVTGGIGAYKAVEIARLLQKAGHEIRVVMTKSARRFVGPLTFEAITRHPVITSQFAPGMNADIEHVSLAASLDLLLIAPATANSIAKLANGLADDFLSSMYLVTRAPVLIAPAMNTNMWEHASVRANVARLRERGAHLVEPGEGDLACGWIGKGRLAEPDQIVAAAERLLRSAPAPAASMNLQGRRVVVTAGPTLEDLDPVRFVGNRSSGRMGFALADAARRRGAEVVLIAGPTTIAPPAGPEVVRVRSAREMHAAVMAHTATADVVLMAAAVADYAPASGAAGRKIEKHEGRDGLTIRLEPTPDILAELGARRGDARRPLLVGFAAQTGDPVAAARRKLQTKRVDLIVANDVTAPGAGFDVETNHVTLVSADGVESLPLMTKTDVAAIVLDRVEQMLASVRHVPVTR
jgi:phosphopantothenoylcysteine decarboxylase/phosphopantothenate--cysteine ligase